ncbi:unnamed protein product [Thelazia callipaeda]|uniref:Apple domain-containing protein n=1 Tax=Thelazia callipaeda TaxID=103827 RepID=A0A0N5CU48_THECL|nr:unnamed protein product [Thelazia callipaeda]
MYDYRYVFAVNIFLLLKLFDAQISATISESFVTGCFLPIYHRGISNSEPIAELWRVDVIDCLSYCITNAPENEDRCSSVVYHRYFSTCQLYSHDGTLHGSQIVYASGHDYYNRTSYIVEREIRKHEAAKVVKEASEIPNTFLNDDEQKNETEDNAEWSVFAFLNQNVAFATCQPDEVIGYLVFTGYESISKGHPHLLHGIEQTDANGNSFPCNSVNYNPIQEICELYSSDLKSKNGLTHLMKKEGSIFADKICLAVSSRFRRSCQQEAMFFTHPGKKITKAIIDYSNGTISIGHCIAICINSFHCQSVTYKNGLCVLHDVDVISDPASMVDATQDSYVIQNGCVAPMTSEQNADEKIENNKWNAWSDCKFGIDGERVRVRSRECGKADCTDLQVQNCF